MDSTELDVVVPCRQGNANEELRYMLRSVSQNFPHRRIVLFGAPPAWVTCDTVPHRQGSNCRVNTTTSMRKACEDKSISNPFIWNADDQFFMRPLLTCPKLNRGPIDTVISELAPKKDSYAQGMVSTKNLLETLGFSNILSYELHMPIIVHKESMLYSLRKYEESRSSNLHKRTLYGNIVDYGGETVSDNKINNKTLPWDRSCTFISTSDLSFRDHTVGAWIRSFFPDPCKYER